MSNFHIHFNTEILKTRVLNDTLEKIHGKQTSVKGFLLSLPHIKLFKQ